MCIEVIAIGDEVLIGDIVNTNAAFISSKLYEKGYAVVKHSVIPDKIEEILQILNTAILRSTCIIVTGGLGPTIDDKTKEGISKFFEVPLVFQEEIAKKLQARYGDISSLKDQASVPQNAEYFLNSIGTAPGLVLQKNKATVIFLPGVPQEMQPMFLADALPYIEKHFPLKKRQYEEKIFLCLVEEFDIDPFIKEIAKKFPHVQIGIYPSFAMLCIALKVRTETKIQAKQILQPVKEEISKKYQKYIFSDDKPTIVEALHDILLKTEYKIACAESCSGGALASAITAMAGSSKYFLGSFVTYANELKKNVLHVSEETLQTQGAVSKETVKEMLEGLLVNTSCDFAIAVSGIAGPSGGSKEKPVGTVYIGIGQRNALLDVGKIQAQGNRSTIVAYCVNYALALLWQRIVWKQPHFVL